jgi:hypothetical protein
MSVPGSTTIGFGAGTGMLGAAGADPSAAFVLVGFSDVAVFPLEEAAESGGAADLPQPNRASAHTITRLRPGALRLIVCSPFPLGSSLMISGGNG